MEQKPKLFGKKWTTYEEQMLLEELQNNMPIQDIAKRHDRSVGGVQSRIHELIYKMSTQNTSIKEIMQKTKLNEDEINEIIKFQHHKALNKPSSNKDNLDILHKEIKALNDRIDKLELLIKTVLLK